MKLIDIIDASEAAAAEAALIKAQEATAKEKDPIILKILTGISAWVASLFLLGFIIVGLSPDEDSIIFLGAVVAGLAILSHQIAKNPGVFVEQSTLSCMMCGHVMLLFGILVHFDRGEELLTLAITQTLLCGFPIWVFKRSAYQASALLLAVFFWTFYAVEMNTPGLFRLLLAVEVTAFGTLTLWRARRDSFTYALALAIGTTIFFLDWVQSLSWKGGFNEALWPTSLIMAALVASIGGHFIEKDERRNPKIIFVFAMLLALAFLSSPGLLYAIALLILGFGLRDTIFGGLGLIALPVFIIYFYYSLQVSLLEKSGILFVSGLVCLLVAYLAHCICRKEPTNS